MKKLVALIMMSIALVGCNGGLDLLTIYTKGVIQDTNGELVALKVVDLCAEVSTSDGEKTVECESIQTDVNGEFEESFSFDLTADLVTYRAYIVLNSEEFEGDVQMETFADVSEGMQTIDTTLSFTVPAGLIQNVVTSFNMSGLVASDENGPFANQYVTVCIFISIQEGEAHRFEQCKVAFTNEFGEYTVTLDVVSNFLFEVETDLIETYVETATVFGGGHNLIQEVVEDPMTGNRGVTMVANFAPKIPVSTN